MTNHYELLYLVGANYTEEELAPIKEKVKELIKKFGGEITAEDSFGKKKLAYPIKKNYQGYYLLYEFNLDGQNLKDLTKNLKLTNEVLRHIIAKKKIKTANEIKAIEERAKKMKAAETASEVKVEKKAKDEGKIKLEDLDQKLDEILEGDIM
ncbi:MAG: 30S ribosomal protein S6 [Patescibacteria group bacterium]